MSTASNQSENNFIVNWFSIWLNTTNHNLEVDGLRYWAKAVIISVKNDNHFYLSHNFFRYCSAKNSFEFGNQCSASLWLWSQRFGFGLIEQIIIG